MADTLSKPLADAPGKVGTSDGVFYRFTDANGRLHVVDSLSAVPPAQRPEATRVELNAPEPEVSLAFPEKIEWTSFALGFAAALLLSLLLSWLRGRAHPLAKLLVAAAAVAVALSLYFGYARRQAGTDSGWFASPSTLVRDAQQAVDKVNRSQREREERLRQMQRDAR